MTANKINRLGWETVPDKEFEDYVKVVRKFNKDYSLFENFRRDPDYGKILSGDVEIIGHHAIANIRELEGLNTFKSNQEEIRRNDSVGNPKIYYYPDFGEINPSTLMYFYNTLVVKNIVGSFVPKRVVEIGAGYGGLCRLLYSMHGFEEYNIIDLPDVVELAHNYLKNFPELNEKINYISCNDLKRILDIKKPDLVIANSSLAELNYDTQSFYTANIFKFTKYAYVIWNTNHIAGKINEMNKFINSFDTNNFIVENKITHSSINNIYIKPKDDNN